MKDKTYGNIVLAAASKGIAVVAYFGADIVSARILPLQEYASWVFYASIKTMIAYIAYFGLNTSAKVMVARSRSEKEKLECLKAGMKLRTIINCIFAIALTCFSQILANSLDAQGKYLNFTYMFWAMGLLVAFESFFEFFKQLGYGLNNYRLLLLVSGVEFGSNFIFTVFFLLIWKNVFGIIWANVIGGALTVIVCAAVLEKNYAFRVQELDIKKETHIWKRLLKYAFPLMACEIANLVALELDTSMIGLLSSEEQIAFYNIGKKLVSKAGHINLAIAGGVMTSFAIINHQNFEERRRKFKKFFCLNMAAALCVCLVLLFFAFGGVALIYGAEYAGAKDVILLLVPYYIMFAVSSFMALFLDFQSKTTFRSAVSIVSVVLNLVLNLVFIPRYGAMGATATTLTSQTVYFGFVCISGINVWRQYRKKYSKGD